MRIGIVAGELSGDQLGASLVKKLKETYPDAIIEGIGGPKMIANGFNSLYPMDALSLIGLFEILASGIKILKIRRDVISHFKKNKPDIFIGIDAPDFNLTVEKKLKSAGIETVHYVSPKIWVWREYRIRKIRKATDSILAILPFEEKYYRERHNFKATFVGHPLAKAIPLEIDRAKYRKELGLDNVNVPILSILPGSRKTEVSRLLPTFLDALEKLVADGYKFQGVMPIAKDSLLPLFEQYKDRLDALPIQLIDGKSHEILKASDYCLLSSGTATLEAMLCKLPMVVTYKLSKISAFVARLFIKGHSYFAFPNIFYGDEIVSELIQENFTSENIVKEVKRLFDEQNRNKKIIKEFDKLHEGMIVDTDQRILEEIQKQISI